MCRLPYIYWITLTTGKATAGHEKPRTWTVSPTDYQSKIKTCEESGCRLPPHRLKCSGSSSYSECCTRLSTHQRMMMPAQSHPGCNLGTWCFNVSSQQLQVIEPTFIIQPDAQKLKGKGKVKAARAQSTSASK